MHVRGRVTECQFADDAAFLASTRAGAERMAVVYQRTSDLWLDGDHSQDQAHGSREVGG